MKKLIYSTVLLLTAHLATAQMSIFDAARDGNIEAAKAMMELNSDTLKSVNSQGYTPMLLATYHNRVEFAKFLLSSGVELIQTEGEQSALHGVCYKGYEELCKVLLEAGANPNLADANGTTPLHYAVQFNHIELVRMMMEHGGDPALKDQSGRSAIDIAKLMNHAEVLELIEP